VTDQLAQRKVSVFAALRSRNFRLLFFGQCLSVLGDGAYVTVLGWFTFHLTGAAGPVALVLGVVTTAKLVALLFGGALADRYDRRMLMLIADIVRGVAMTALTAFTVLDKTSIGLLIAIAALVGVFDALFSPSFMGIVPSLVEDEALLVSANGLIGFVRSSGGIAGPVLGGALYAAFGPSVVFGANAATFFWAALLVFLARTPAQARSEPRNPLHDIAEGARYVRGMPILVLSIPVAALAMMLSDAPTQTLLPRLITEQFQGGAFTLGAFETALGIGFAAGALLAAKLNPTTKRSLLVFGAWTLSHFVCAVLVLLPSTPAAVALFFVRGVLTGFGIVLWETLLMSLVPPDKLSRVFSVDTFGSSGMLPVGFALAGLAAPLASAGTLIALGQGVAGLLMLSLLAVRRIRTVQ
jgi:MFS family permease